MSNPVSTSTALHELGHIVYNPYSDFRAVNFDDGETTKFAGRILTRAKLDKIIALGDSQVQSTRKGVSGAVGSPLLPKNRN